MNCHTRLDQGKADATEKTNEVIRRAVSAPMEKKFIQKAYAYVATDGSRHETLEKARDHSAMVELTAFLEGDSDVDPNVREAIEKIAANRTKVSAMLNIDLSEAQ